MPNDAKLGMVAGVALVIVVAVVFFRRDAAAGSTTGPKAVTPAPRTTGVRPPMPTPPRPVSEKAGRAGHSAPFPCTSTCSEWLPLGHSDFGRPLYPLRDPS